MGDDDGGASVSATLVVGDGNVADSSTFTWASVCAVSGICLVMCSDRTNSQLGTHLLWCRNGWCWRRWTIAHDNECRGVGKSKEVEIYRE